MNADIVPATEDDFARFYRGVVPTAQWMGSAVRKGRLVAGFGGALEVSDGIWFAFLDVPAHLRSRAIYKRIILALAEIRRRGGREVRAMCDETIPRAKEMLERLGFEPTDEVIDGKAVWHVRT